MLEDILQRHVSNIDPKLATKSIMVNNKNLRYQPDVDEIGLEDDIPDVNQWSHQFIISSQIHFNPSAQLDNKRHPIQQQTMYIIFDFQHLGVELCNRYHQ